MASDTLREMLAMKQSAQAERGYTFSTMTKAERVEYIKKHVQYLTVELGEFLVELPGFKDWKKYPQDMPIDNGAAKEELIDALHFMLNIFLAMGMSAEDIYRTYLCKADVNQQRLADTVHYKRDTEDAE